MRLRPHPSTPTPAATSTAKDEDSTLDHELTFRPHTAQKHTSRPPAYHQLFPHRVIPRREHTEKLHSDVRISPILDMVRKSQQTKQKEAAKRAAQEANKMSITTIDEGRGIAVGYHEVGVGRMEALGAPAPAPAVTSHYPHIPITSTVVGYVPHTAATIAPAFAHCAIHTIAVALQPVQATNPVISQEEPDDSIVPSISSDDSDTNPAQEAITTSSLLSHLGTYDGGFNNFRVGESKVENPEFKMVDFYTREKVGSIFGAPVAPPASTLLPDVFAIQETAPTFGASLSKFEKGATLNTFGRTVFGIKVFNKPTANASSEFTTATSIFARSKHASKSTVHLVFGPSLPPPARVELHIFQHNDTEAMRLLVLGQPINTMFALLAARISHEVVRLHQMLLQSARPIVVSESAIVAIDASASTTHGPELEGQVAKVYPPEQWALVLFRTPPSMKVIAKRDKAKLDDGNNGTSRSSS
jgi:hypothetical protein